MKSVNGRVQQGQGCFDGSLLSPCFLKTKLKTKSAVGLCTILLISLKVVSHLKIHKYLDCEKIQVSGLLQVHVNLS